MPSYSDAEMRAIVGRALQIDTGRSDRFTPEQLRAIAAELGISNQALEVAMYEADSKGRGMMVDAPQPASTGVPRWAKGVAVAVGAALVIAASTFAFMRTTPPPARAAPAAHSGDAAEATPVAPTATPTPAAPTKSFPAVKKTTKKVP
jgi:hypothetical protein